MKVTAIRERFEVTTIRYLILSWAAIHLSILINIIVVKETRERCPERKSNSTPTTQRARLLPRSIFIAKKGCTRIPTQTSANAKLDRRIFVGSQREDVRRIATRTSVLQIIAETEKNRFKAAVEMCSTSVVGLG